MRLDVPVPEAERFEEASPAPRVRRGSKARRPRVHVLFEGRIDEEISVGTAVSR